MEMHSKLTAERFFGGRRVWIWVGLAFAYGLSFFVTFLTRATTLYHASLGVYFDVSFACNWTFCNRTTSASTCTP